MNRLRPLRILGITTRVGCAGLCLVLVALSGFAAISAAVIARASSDARSSSDVRQVSVQVYKSLLPLHGLVNEAVQRPSAESRADYRAAEASAADALAAITRLHGPDDAAVRRALADFSTYKTSVRRMLVLAERRPAQPGSSRTGTSTRPTRRR